MKKTDNLQYLRIAQVAPLWISVPPTTYGGTERIVHLLTEELVKRGHAVTLFATGDSKTSAKLRSVCDCSLNDTMAEGMAYEYEHYANSGLAMAIREQESFDVIHCHLGYELIPFSAITRVPLVHTIHTVPCLDDQWVLRQYPDVPVVAASLYQTTAISAERRQNIAVISHGIDFSAYELSTAPGKYLVFLGRMGSQKSPLDAIHIAKAAGMRIVLAGQPQDDSEETYFAEKIRPVIDGTNVIYVGPVDHLQKNELLKNASALLFPIQGDEAFGLIMIEAMACGTPVLAFKAASVSEVVDYGKTGFYADSIEVMVSLIPKAMLLDRNTIRNHAMQRFSHMRMVNEYLELYRSLVARWDNGKSEGRVEDMKPSVVAAH